MSMFTIYTLIFVFIAFCLGASIASFLGVVVERGRKGESILGRSHCACGRQLKNTENIPVIGWLKIGGKTKCCNTKLPVSYLLSELGLGLLFAGITLYLLVGLLL